MTTHARTGFAHLILGSVAEKVVRESACPVLTIRQEDEVPETASFRSILVPVDIADRSAAALICARQIAEWHDSIVYPLHVSNDPARTFLEMEKEVGADLLIMATHGFTGMFHLLLGSLTEKMMREAGCPVLALHQ